MKNKPPSRSAPPPPQGKRTRPGTLRYKARQQRARLDAAKRRRNRLLAPPSSKPSTKKKRGPESVLTTRPKLPHEYTNLPETKTGSYILKEGYEYAGNRRVKGGISKKKKKEKERIRNQSKPTGPWVGKCTKALKKICNNKSPPPPWCKPCLKEEVCRTIKEFCKKNSTSKLCSCPEKKKKGHRLPKKGKM